MAARRPVENDVVKRAGNLVIVELSHLIQFAESGNEIEKMTNKWVPKNKAHHGLILEHKACIFFSGTLARHRDAPNSGNEFAQLPAERSTTKEWAQSVISPRAREKHLFPSCGRKGASQRNGNSTLADPALAGDNVESLLSEGTG